VLRALEGPLREALAVLGYGDRADAAPSCRVEPAACLAAGGLEHSAHGTLAAEADGVLTVRVTGNDFWVELPPAPLRTDAVREVWVSVCGDTGDHCSLYWRRAGEGFDEGRCVHVPFHPGAHWRVLRFPLRGHPHWHGTVAQLRVDLFNGAVDPSAGGGRFRWLLAVE
jgi:hypothetical protein